MQKTYLWIAIGIGCVATALSAALLFWPRGNEATTGPLVVHEPRSNPTQQSPDFENATVLTATAESIASTALPQSLPSMEPSIVRPAFDVETSEVTKNGHSESAPFSFMPKRLSLSENNQWQNGWDEPVAAVGEELLSKLPDWSTAAEWLTPAQPVAGAETSSAIDEPKLGEQVSPPALPGGTSSYTVRTGDTLWTISQKVYGTGALFAALAKHNQSVISDPRSLKVGQTIAIPAGAWLSRRYAHLCPEPRPAEDQEPMPPADSLRRPKYAVKAGDTLERIAVIRLGRADRWREILALNHAVVGASGGYLTPGMILTLPDDARSTATVLRPTDHRR